MGILNDAASEVVFTMLFEHFFKNGKPMSWSGYLASVGSIQTGDYLLHTDAYKDIRLNEYLGVRGYNIAAVLFTKLIPRNLWSVAYIALLAFIDSTPGIRYYLWGAAFRKNRFLKQAEWSDAKVAEWREWTGVDRKVSIDQFRTLLEKMREENYQS